MIIVIWYKDTHSASIKEYIFFSPKSMCYYPNRNPEHYLIEREAQWHIEDFIFLDKYILDKAAWLETEFSKEYDSIFETIRGRSISLIEREIFGDDL